MSTGAGGATPPPGVDPSGLGPELQTPFVERYGLAQRAEGILAPLLTTVLAFLVGGLVVIVTTGKNPLTTYRAIFDGAGLSWFFEIGNNKIGLPWSDATVWFPWNVNDIESVAAVNLQQTLIVTTTLVFTGLAVAFAFRCGLFNIGGQGQYIVGSIWAVWIGSSFEGMNPFLHITLAIVVATLAGAVWAGIAGFLKATVGAHEVISTIMLNWIAIWVGSFLFGLGGPLQNDQQSSVPISNDIFEGATPTVTIYVNDMPEQELTTRLTAVRGIGPVTVANIVAGRPFTRHADLDAAIGTRYANILRNEFNVRLSRRGGSEA